MPSVLTIKDEHLSTGDEEHTFELEFPTESITVRELIRERVYQEVDDLNRRARDAGASAKRYSGLITPSDLEQSLNGERQPGAKQVDWKKQFEVAQNGFERRRFLVLVGERQAESLDETIQIGRDTEVTFLRLVMLVGG